MAGKRSHRLRGLSRVGRVGELTLGFSRQGGATILARARSQSPWHCLPPVALAPSGGAYLQLMNPSGGLVGGDELFLRASLGAHTHVLLSTPSATKVYRSSDRISRQSVRCRLGSGALLEWVPEPIIPFAGSRFRQDLRMILERGAALVLWDAVASGRIARGERWAFASLDNDVRIMTPGGEVCERYSLSSSSCAQGIQSNLLADWDYVGSLFVIGDGFRSEIWEDLADQLADVLESGPRGVLGGVSETAVPGVIVKVVARAAPPLQEQLLELWSTVRRVLWNLPNPMLRRY